MTEKKPKTKASNKTHFNKGRKKKSTSDDINNNTGKVNKEAEVFLSGSKYRRMGTNTMNNSTGKKISNSTAEQPGLRTTITTNNREEMGEGDGEETITVTLENLEINKKDWILFESLVLITPLVKKEFLSDRIQDFIHELLFENPDLFNYYVKRSVKRRP